MKNGIRFLSFLLALCSAISLLSLPLLIQGLPFAADALAAQEIQTPTVVLDAGHGGEDGGAVSGNGTFEKDINLSVTLLLRDLLELNGMTVVLTRETDTLLYDKNADYQGRKKVLDLAARRNIAESTENCIFVSIHMNAFPQEKYHGLQVWYSRNHPASKLLAQTVQTAAKEKLQPDNGRSPKEATSSIYLLHHLKMPSILIECGFLSNSEEAAMLADKEYQKQLAMLLFFSLTDGIEKIHGEFGFPA